MIDTRIGSLGWRMLLALLLGGHLAAVPCPGWGAEAAALPVLGERLPTEPYRRPLSGGASAPYDAFRGRAGVFLFLDAEAASPSELEGVLVHLQEEFAPWLRWGLVLTGPSRTRPGNLRPTERKGTPRWDECWSDPDGTWRSSFRVPRLPTAVLVNESGYVTLRQVGWQPADEPGFLRAVERLVGASRLSGQPVRDFKLEEGLAGGFRTFADLPARDFTLLLSVKPDCTACLEELAVLREFGRRHPGRVTLVAIDHDEPQALAGSSPAQEDQAGCDVTLNDPGRLYAERYHLGGVPTLLVVDRRGTIVLARSGFLPEERAAIAGNLELLAGQPAAPGEEAGRFAEFLRVRAEGLALLGAGRAGLATFFLERALELDPGFYTVQVPLAQAYAALGKPREAARALARYLAAEPRAGDRAAVLAQLRALAADRDKTPFPSGAERTIFGRNEEGAAVGREKGTGPR